MRQISNLDREGPARGGHHAGIAQPRGDRLGVECRAHHDHPQVRPDRPPQLDQHAENQIHFGRPLMKLIEDNRPDASERHVIKKPPQQDARGLHNEGCLPADPGIESHLITNLTTNGSTPQPGNLSRDTTGWQPSGL